MSVETRNWVAYHENMFYGTGAGSSASIMISDLERIPTSAELYTGTQTTLIAALQFLLQQKHIIELTIVQTGHHNDGPNGHAGGRAVDCWPLKTAKQDDWLDATDQRFYQFLYDFGRCQYARQTGMVGDGSDSTECFHYAEKGYIERGTFVRGMSVFQDSGGAHIHLGSI